MQMAGAMAGAGGFNSVGSLELDDAGNVTAVETRFSAGSGGGPGLFERTAGGQRRLQRVAASHLPGRLRGCLWKACWSQPAGN